MTHHIRRNLLASLVLVVAGGTAALALTPQDIAERYQAQGYTHIEIKQGLTQTKVEAIRGSEKLEIVFDRATGAILKSETEQASRAEMARTGVTVRDRGRDFVRSARSDDDDDGDDDNGRGRGRGSDDRGSDDRGSDDRDSDDRDSDDRGSDDSDSDDNDSNDD